MLNRSDVEIVEAFFLNGYQEGLIHGFTLGRGKQPRPEDIARMEQMIQIMKKRLKDDFEAQKGETDADSQEQPETL